MRRPSGDDAAVTVEGIRAPPAADRVGEYLREDVRKPSHADRRRVRSARGVIELLRRCDYVRAAISGYVAQRRSRDYLGARNRAARLTQQLGEAGQRVATSVPGIDVLVERGNHDLELSLLSGRLCDEIAEHRRGREAALDVILTRAILRE